MDKTTWGPGPWQAEPDRVQWRTAAGLPGLIVRNRGGAWCGYVAVPPGHALFEVSDADVDVHGGLTYSGHCQVDGPICHVPEPGEPDNVWWLGFDCEHITDRGPAREARERELGLPTIGDIISEPVPTYKTMEWVRSEVEQLAAQLVHLG
jgi:hypothetical protein